MGFQLKTDNPKDLFNFVLLFSLAQLIPLPTIIVHLHNVYIAVATNWLRAVLSLPTVFVPDSADSINQIGLKPNGPVKENMLVRERTVGWVEFDPKSNESYLF